MAPGAARMTDALAHCPTVPFPHAGTVGQHGTDYPRSGTPSGTEAGTVSLKSLAALVLARDTGRDRQRDTPAATCPTYLAGAAATVGHPAPLAATLDLSGVPPSWAEGVALLRSRPAPSGATVARWARFQDDAGRLLAEHGAALHRLGWDALDVFGLHRWAPFARPDAMGVAWLLDGRPIAALAADAVTFATRSGGTLRARRMGQHVRGQAVPAWMLEAAGA